MVCALAHAVCGNLPACDALVFCASPTSRAQQLHLSRQHPRSGYGVRAADARASVCCGLTGKESREFQCLSTPVIHSAG